MVSQDVPAVGDHHTEHPLPFEASHSRESCKVVVHGLASQSALESSLASAEPCDVGKGQI